MILRHVRLVFAADFRCSSSASKGVNGAGRPDVQDLLHAILKLHFDDVRPEEWTPSYGGNASRVDFFLPGERLIIEAKMTRASLGQKEVVNELTIDAARYEKVAHVDHLICIVYDPDRRCSNPAALETDLARTGGRLKVTAIVCPRGA